MTRPESHGERYSCVYPLSSLSMIIEDEFDGAEIGETISLTYCEMTEEELEDMPEFEGW